MTKTLSLPFAGLLAACALAQQPNLDRDPTLYVVGYAHLDTEWRWSYRESIVDYLPRTLRDNFRLFEKYPHYVFNFTGSNRYRLMKEYYPADYARMKEYVAKGRWFPGGSSVEEGDVNSPSLESLIRQIAYGNRFFRQEFGKESSEYMLPDCFGFPAALPSILAHCGLKGFSTQKLTWGSAVGIPFNLGVWEGPDGRSTVAALNPDNYVGTITGDLSENPYWLDRVRKNGEKSGVFADYKYFGTGDMGGAPDEQSVANLEKSLSGKGSLKVLGGTSARLFDDLQPAQIGRLPRYKGDLELTEHSAGSLTSQAEMKKLNHENEKLGAAAEAAAVAARMVAGTPFPAKTLDAAWSFFLPGQFHDLMAGTALPKAYEYALNDQFVALNLFQTALTDSVERVAQRMRTEGPGVPIVVFNPVASERQDPFEVEVRFPGRAPELLSVNGPDGPVESQELSRSGSSVRLLIQSKLPGLSFATFHVQGSDPTMADKKPLAVGRILENERLKVLVGDTGDVVSIYDKRARREVLAAPIRLAFQHENPRDYPAWNMDWADQQKPPYAYLGGDADIKVVERGPVRGAIRIERSAFGSRFVQEVRLSKDSDRVEFLDQVDWRTPSTALKASFTLSDASPSAAYNEQVGVIERGNNEPRRYEAVSHQWFDVTNPEQTHGASILTRDKFGSDKPSDAEVRLTLLYTPGVQGGYEDQASQDWGRHEILYGLRPHSGSWREGTPQEAEQLDQPVLAFQTEPHPGDLGPSWRLLDVGASNVSVGAVKPAMDPAQGVIVRLRENAGQAASGSIRIGGSAASEFVEVDGQERPLAQPIHEFRLAPFEVRAYRIRLSSREEATPTKTLPIPRSVDVVSRTDAPGDGSFSKRASVSLPAEQTPDLPSAPGEKNGLSCDGQTISIDPKGGWLELVATSSAGPRQASFMVGREAQTVSVGGLTGYLGQWDTRLWEGKVEPVAYGWRPSLAGIVPGYLHSQPLAQVCTHLHDASGDRVYEYGYLYRLRLRAEPGTKTLTLPKDPSIVIFSARQVSDCSPVRFCSPAIESFDAKIDPPKITAKSPSRDATQVTVQTGWYGDSRQLMVSIDGGKPSRYTGPFWLARSATVRTFYKGCEAASSLAVEVDDRTAPKVSRVRSWQKSKRVTLSFSEPILDAENLRHYRVGKDNSVVSARVSGHGTEVELDLARSPGSAPFTLALDSIRDTSPRRNALVSRTLRVRPSGPIVAGFSTQGGNPVTMSLPSLPVWGGYPWTLSFETRMDREPDPLTPIAGFGDSQDSAGDGSTRYICQFQKGIHFWGRNVDVDAGERFRLHVWQTVKATYDGHLLSLYLDGKLLTREAVPLRDAKATFSLAPLDGWDGKRRFQGEIRNFEIWDEVVE